VVETCLFAEPLLKKSCRIFSYPAVVAQQRTHTQQYIKKYQVLYTSPFQPGRMAKGTIFFRLETVARTTHSAWEVTKHLLTRKQETAAG
jgi:hypothetical protein